MLNNHSIDFYKTARTNLREGQTEAINEERNHFYILYVSSGKGTLVSGEQQIKAEEGKSYFLPDAGKLTSAASALLSVFMLAWPKEGDMLSGFLSGRLAEQAPVKMVPLWEELRKWNEKKSISAKCRFQALLWEMLSVLTDGAEVDRMEEAVELIRNSLSRPFTVAELASKANMSPVTFSRAFRKRTGMTPKEFLNVERLKVAKKLMLQKKGITAKEVALQ
jgi:AraC-like DNA-binding protein